MTVRQRALSLPILAILFLAGASPASAQDAFADPQPYGARVLRRPAGPPPPYAIPYGPPPVISGYLPRNNAVPMYNEPPSTRALGFGPR